MTVGFAPFFIDVFRVDELESLGGMGPQPLQQFLRGNVLGQGNVHPLAQAQDPQG